MASHRKIDRRDGFLVLLDAENQGTRLLAFIGLLGLLQCLVTLGAPLVPRSLTLSLVGIFHRSMGKVEKESSRAVKRPEQPIGR